MTLQEFLAHDTVRNAWLREKNLSIYVRKGRRYINGSPVPTLELANINVDEPFRGTGVFTAFLQRAESLKTPLYIENVMDLRFQEYFRKRGYTVLPVGDESVGVLCFYKLPNQEIT